MWISDFGFRVLETFDYQCFIETRNTKSEIRNPKSTIKIARYYVG
jgi:hypothetical protein